MTSPLLVAVDAGNSKTCAVAADLDGGVVGTGWSGAGDIYAVGEERAVSAVAAAVDDALAAAGARGDDVVAAALHLAGVDWPEDEEFWSGRAARMFPRARRVVRNDGFALLRIADPTGAGVAVTVGTGPAIAARSAVAEAAMSFWCRDAIGGAALGDRALDAVVLAEQDLGPATRLREALLAEFGAADLEDLLHVITRRHAGARISTAARTVLRCAEDGDPVATRIVADDVAALVRYILPTAVRAGLDPDGAWPVVLGGSVMASDISYYREAALSAARRELPAARIVATPVAPVLGTLLDAFAVHEPSSVSRVRTRIIATTP